MSSAVHPPPSAGEGRKRSLLYRAVLFCGIAPLLTGIGILLLWIMTRREVLESAGFYCIFLGTGIVMVGVMLLAVWWQRPEERSEISRWKPGLLAILILLINVPAAAGAVFVALTLKHPLRSIAIQDVTREETITLTTELQYPNSLEIRVVGQLDGPATVSRDPSSTLALKPGLVDAAMGGDWYSSQCRLRYHPQDVKSGRLRIDYRFR